MVTSVRTAPRGRIAPKTFTSDPEEHRRLLAETAESLFARVGELERTAQRVAYGGMRYRTSTPVNLNVGTTPQQITLYDTGLPRNGEELGVKFDTVAKHLKVLEGGIYRISLYFNFIGEAAGVNYLMSLYLDEGGGASSAGTPIDFKLLGGGNELALQLTTYARLSANQLWSVWVAAGAANQRFEVRQSAVFMERIGLVLPDVAFDRTGYWL